MTRQDRVYAQHADLLGTAPRTPELEADIRRDLRAARRSHRRRPTIAVYAGAIAHGLRAGTSVLLGRHPEPTPADPQPGREMLHLFHRPGPDDPDTRRSLVVSRPWTDGRVCLHSVDLDGFNGPTQVVFAVAPEDVQRLADQLHYYAGRPTLPR